ncbi:hypothetical protein CC53_gp009 [Rhizobium phage vB_RleS_L338C]|uniref:hypothetical protein n=1 Tax=Rhizobium phage vB_RleS_L338C TaxID=1414737 RepID=UPI0003D894E9|nr:hypothetical protein CC53_gp009 [Rhizobium phage vB_RleS_L338C]AHC30426.1 hypothetical protein L338C_009 [Rhizobium phage vB_RleS_L338C]QNH72093.1 hypothetical protein P11VFA_128 [Rhizobium phage P11VFA]
MVGQTIPVTATMDVEDFELKYAADWYDIDFALTNKDGSEDLQRSYVWKFPSFVPNPFYMDDRENFRPRYAMPDVVITTDGNGYEVRLCEMHERVGVLPRRTLTAQEWVNDEGIKRWREFALGQEDRDQTIKWLEQERREKATEARKKREAAEKARRLEDIKKSKNALRVVRKVSLD